MANNIMQYESKIWATADLLRGVGFKESTFPEFMMPFFALMMVESRLIREADKIRGDFDLPNKMNDFLSEIQDMGQGYNEYILKNNKSLSDIVKNDKNFDTDFELYLKSFDPETRDLLGVNKGEHDEKYLDISGKSGQLRKKGILFAFVKEWAEIDLKPFDNSEITTLEEHIKRKWADISAETAGEQYTPNDIISLIGEICAHKLPKEDSFVTIYDPACGGGNMLFGVEDKIKDKLNRPTATFGQDWNDALYALAKIESRFREDSDIKYGNTLTTIPHISKKFDIIVANPPYGVDWKGYEKDIRNDKTERFIALPSISDGQLLFAQHIIYQLSNNGIAVVVHNGSSLFSGDAGSGESQIRKYFFDNDWIEAIIQLPTDEFFNTGIYTYLWVFNKNKSDERKNKVILINASEKYDLLKKFKGKKRKEITEKGQLEIVEALDKFEDNDFAKVLDKDSFYHNKQSLILTNLDENGKSLENYLGDKKSLKLNPIKVTKDNEIIFDNLEITQCSSDFSDLQKFNADCIQIKINELDYKEQNIKIYTTEGIYYFNNDKETIIKETNKKVEELGCGKIIIKSNYKKTTKTQSEKIVITVELIPDYQKDYEIVPFSRIEEENKKNIDCFITKHITNPYKLLDNTVGVGLTFNKFFLKTPVQESIVLIIKDIEKLRNELEEMQNSIKDIITGRVDKNTNLKDSCFNWLGKVPSHWLIKRNKDLFIESKKTSLNGSEDLLSVSEYTGVTIKSKDFETGENDSRAESLTGYKICEKNNLVINIMLAWKGALGISEYDGIVSPAYCVFKFKNISNYYPKYYHYLFKTNIYTFEFNRNSTGIIDSRLRLYPDSFLSIPVIVPPIEEQMQIVKQLDYLIEKVFYIKEKIKGHIDTLNTFEKSIIGEIIFGNTKFI